MGTSGRFGSRLVLVTRADLPVSTLADLLTLARSNPGGLTYASSGPGTPYHMAGELFKSMAGIDVVHVPYKGSPPAVTDVVTGQVQFMLNSIPTILPLAKVG